MSPRTKGSKKLKKSKHWCLSRIVGQEPLDQRQQKAQEIPKLMPFKKHGTRAQWRKAAKSSRNPKIDAFQDSWDKSPRTKGSKKLKKSQNWCLSRFVGQEPPDQRQQKAQEILKLMPFKKHGTRALRAKAAKSSRNPKINAFQELKEMSPRTKGSKKPKKSQNWCLSRIVGQEPPDERQQKAQEILKLMPFKNCWTRALRAKAAKSSRNPKIDAFQDLWDKSPQTKGSKKTEKSKNRCLSRFMGQEPPDQRQQKAQEIQKLMPFKKHGTRAQWRKAAKTQEIQNIDAF